MAKPQYYKGMPKWQVWAALAGAIALGKLSESLLYQLKGSDPVVLIGAAAALALVAVGAGFILAHRASAVEPMRALRYE